MDDGGDVGGVGKFVVVQSLTGRDGRQEAGLWWEEEGGEFGLTVVTVY